LIVTESAVSSTVELRSSYLFKAAWKEADLMNRSAVPPGTWTWWGWIYTAQCPWWFYGRC